MSLKALLLVTLLFPAHATGVEASSMTTLKAMEKVFARSEATHTQSMAAIMKDMSAKKAWNILENRNLSSASLIQLKDQLNRKHRNLRQTPSATADANANKPNSNIKSGYSGIEGARKMLNDMIYKSNLKYDEEIQDCKAAYAQVCADMEASRSQMTAANYMCAESRALLLDAQARAERCKVDIPKAEDDLSQHLDMCKREISHMNARLKIIEGDLTIIEGILNLTECKATFMQTTKLNLLQCQDPCTKKTFFSFNQKALQMQLGQLKSKVSKELVQDTLQQLVSKPISFLQSPNDDYEPVVEVPTDPCTDKSAGAPDERHKDMARCILGPGGPCEELREKFLGVQGGIEDEQERILLAIKDFISFRDSVERALKAQIENDENIDREAQKAEAEAVKKLAECKQWLIAPMRSMRSLRNR